MAEKAGKARDTNRFGGKVERLVRKDNKSRKTVFFRLAANAVRDVHTQRDAKGLYYARKAIIITELAFSTNGK